MYDKAPSKFRRPSVSKSLGVGDQLCKSSLLRARAGHRNEINLGSWIGSYWNPKGKDENYPRLARRISSSVCRHGPDHYPNKKGKSGFEFTVFNRKYDHRHSEITENLARILRNNDTAASSHHLA